MENQKCPVCENEYVENKDRCGKCGWILKDFPNIISTQLDLIELQKQINTIGKNIWYSWEKHHLKKINMIQEELNSQIKKLTQEKEQLQSQIMAKELDEIFPEGEYNPNSIERESLISDITPLIKNVIKEILNQEIENKINPQFMMILNRLELLAKIQITNSVESGSQTDNKTLDEPLLQFSVNNYEKPIEILVTQEEKDLVDSYNNDIDLTEFITEVAETEESQNNRQKGSQKLAIFKKERRGNYWIVTVQDRYYLVPKKKLKINEYNYSTIAAIFEYRGYVPGKSDNFILKKPGKIALLITNEYQLEETGMLTTLDEMIQLSVVNTEQHLSMLTTLDEEIESSLVKNKQENADIILTPEEKDIVYNYNNKVHYLTLYVKEVSETAESIFNRRDNSQKSAIFKTDRQGLYWVVTVQQRHYLVPSKKFKIDEYSYSMIQTLFECYGYTPGKSDNFILKKPGKISFLKGNQYQLEEPGILEF